MISVNLRTFEFALYERNCSAINSCQSILSSISNHGNDGLVLLFEIWIINFRFVFKNFQLEPLPSLRAQEPFILMIDTRCISTIPITIVSSQFKPVSSHLTIQKKTRYDYIELFCRVNWLLMNVQLNHKLKIVKKNLCSTIKLLLFFSLKHNWN